MGYRVSPVFIIHGSIGGKQECVRKQSPEWFEGILKAFGGRPSFPA